MSIGLHNLKRPKGLKRRSIKGRGSGSGSGKTSGRGVKGQKSRTGAKSYVGFEGGQVPLIRKIPKRGFRRYHPKTYQIINIKDLNRIGEHKIDPQALERGRLIKDKFKPVKILGQGSIAKPITIKASAFSKSAKDKIKEAGGAFEVI